MPVEIAVPGAYGADERFSAADTAQLAEKLAESKYHANQKIREQLKQIDVLERVSVNLIQR